MNKKFFTALCLISLCAAGGFAQEEPYRSVHSTKPPQEFQAVIQSQTHRFFDDLSLALRGQYKKTQERFAAQAEKTARDVNARPYKYFDAASVSAANADADWQEKMENAANEAAQKAKLLERYNKLQKLISANVSVFPSYVLTGKMNLTLLGDETMSNLENIFAGRHAENTRGYKYEKVTTPNGPAVKVYADQSVYVLVTPHNRHIKIYQNEAK